jgi:hypothetical protein
MKPEKIPSFLFQIQKVKELTDKSALSEKLLRNDMPHMPEKRKVACLA